MSNSGKATLENSIKGDIDLELIGGTEQLTTIGKNLANPSEFVIGTLAGDTGNIINLKQYITTGYIPVIPGKRYSTSCGNKFLAHTIIAYDKEKTKINSPINMSSEMPEGAAYIRQAYRKIDMTNVTESDMEELKKVCMVNEGSTVLPYEPYTGLKPSPSPEYPKEIKSAGKWNKATGKYEIDIILNGSNLWKEDSMIRGHLTANGEIVYKEDDSSCIWTVVAPRDGKYAVRIEKESVGGLYFTRIFNDKTSEPYVRLNPGQKGVLMLKKGENKIQASSTSALRPIGNEKVMLSYGDQEPPTYEPYQEPQALTLTSDRPITKWDKLVEQGGEYGWLYGSKIYVVTGNEVFESRDGYNIESYTNRFFILNDLLKENDALKPLAYMKCLRNVQYVYSPNIFEEGFETNINQFHIKLSNDRVGILASDDHAVRTAKFSEYMKKIHKNGNPIEILYATTDTVFLPLPQSEQTQLRNLHSYNGTTHVFVDSGEVECGIKVAYKQNK